MPSLEQQPDKEVQISAKIPERLATLIAEKADKEGIEFEKKSGYYILLGIEAERKQ